MVDTIRKGGNDPGNPARGGENQGEAREGWFCGYGVQTTDSQGGRD